jgi:hypothetical protein
MFESIVWKLKLATHMELFKLKQRIHRAVKRNRKKILLYAFLMCLLTVGTVAAQIYWSRTIVHEINVYGINAELLKPDVHGYLDKYVATSLYGGQVALVINAENFYDVWLNVTFSSAAAGLQVHATGQYYLCSAWTGPFTFDPQGSTFDVTGYHVIDKTKMMYANGGALVISFAFDTELVTLPGSYTVNLRFEMGFV